MKAFGCNNYDFPCGVIVFAETQGKARSMAHGEPGFDSTEWIDIDARRLPNLDGKRGSECVLDWQDDARIYYEAGWYPEEGAPLCDICGKHEYDSIPESEVIETGEGRFICVSCKCSECDKTATHEVEGMPEEGKLIKWLPMCEECAGGHSGCGRRIRQRPTERIAK